MLTGKNVVIIKGDSQTPTVVKQYDRVYLEYAATDKTETFEKTSEGKTLQVDGANWQGVRPSLAISAAPVEDLVSEALAYFTSRYPKANPYNTLLEAASYGADLWERNTIQAELRPSKPIDQGAAIAKMVKVLMALNPKLTMVKSTAVATAAAASE